jgi:hypothetical protein
VFTVVATKEFDNQMQTLFGKYPRMAELSRAIEWSLRRNPRGMGLEISEDIFVWLTTTLPTDDIPVVRIVYHINYDKKKVKLISIAEPVDPRRN